MKNGVIHFFKALGNLKRLEIIELLLRQRELPLEEISRRIDLSYKSISKHLLLLENRGIVVRRQRSLRVFYSIKGDRKTYLFNILEEVKKIIKAK
ncbi:MAG: winged helix-turn-helix transcriptional regulator [Candidatus Omnitrophica bacterium]|nr:winged helix-turn-helix transcriptional regulator [Candidatus Omnitrophota bacterium]